MYGKSLEDICSGFPYFIGCALSESTCKWCDLWQIWSQVLYDTGTLLKPVSQPPCFMYQQRPPNLRNISSGKMEHGLVLYCAVYHQRYCWNCSNITIPFPNAWKVPSSTKIAILRGPYDTALTLVPKTVWERSICFQFKSQNCLYLCWQYWVGEFGSILDYNRSRL